MSDMRIMGSYSGIDMSTVEQLIKAESSKGVKFTQKKEQYTQSKNAWKDLNTRLDSLYKRLDDLQKTDTYVSKSVKLSDNTNMTVSAKTTAAPGEYRVQVERLATQTRLTGTRVESVESIHDELTFSGTFSINNGEDYFEVSVEATDSLSDVSDKINSHSKQSGIRSSIVDNRLILTHSEFGARNITVTEADVEGTLTDSLGLSNAESKAGENAKFTIDGLEIEERPTNTISDVIEGLTFNLTNVHEGAGATIVTVSEDMNKAVDTLQKFVDQYNSTQTYIKSQLDVGDPSADSNKTGTLSGDGTLMRLQSNLRMMMSRQSFNGTSVQGLKDLGVEISRDGTASFDRKVLEEKIKNDPQAVSDFFSKTDTIPKKTDEDGEVTPASTKKKGFAVEMRSFVNEYISDSSGIIKTRNDTFDRMIKDVNDRISQFETRLEAKKARYIKQFTALDTAMMMAESQLDQMYSQLGLGRD
ncbi:flagellar filament capping protein FliD [Alkalibacterium sp. 20]|uniref:flagellar filament capping protein FliD n=1 Tax=Alkalibacterium sp. 20 TaxID=1798803 RepID=UPI00090041B5|nr:flagellar filament capping protein FliD [Alkalibacterium sp. 20]